MTRTCTHGLPFLKGVYGRSVVVQVLSVVIFKSVWVQTKVDVIHQFLQTGDIQSSCRSPRCVIQKFKLNEKVLSLVSFSVTVIFNKRKGTGR